MDSDHPVGDEVAPQPNGTVRIGIQGRFVSLRRPTLGEFKKLNELWAGVIAQDKELAEKADAIPRDDRSMSWKTDYETELALSHAGWALEAMRLLAVKDGDIPAVDEAPAWMGSVTFRDVLYKHWTTVPLVASSR